MASASRKKSRATRSCSGRMEFNPGVSTISTRRSVSTGRKISQRRTSRASASRRGGQKRRDSQRPNGARRTVVVDHARLGSGAVAKNVDRRGRRRDTGRCDLGRAERVHEGRLAGVELAHDRDQQGAIERFGGPADGPSSARAAPASRRRRRAPSRAGRRAARQAAGRGAPARATKRRLASSGASRPSSCRSARVACPPTNAPRRRRRPPGRPPARRARRDPRPRAPARCGPPPAAVRTSAVLSRRRVERLAATGPSARSPLETPPRRGASPGRLGRRRTGERSRLFQAAGSQEKPDQRRSQRDVAGPRVKGPRGREPRRDRRRARAGPPRQRSPGWPPRRGPRASATPRPPPRRGGPAHARSRAPALRSSTSFGPPSSIAFRSSRAAWVSLPAAA